MKDSIMSQFDEIIGQHFERLIGTKHGIGELPLNIATIVCFVLLGGREIEIDNSPSEAIERYTHDSFLHEAAAMCIDPDEYFKTGLQDMVQRGYVEVDSDGRFFTQQSTITMVRVLDRIFPKMPGINFLAYIRQTIEEAITGRTDIEVATYRFDQTLKHHGVPVLRQKSLDVSFSRGTQTSQGSDDIHQKKQISREQILAELYSRAKIPEQPTASPSSIRSNQKILAGGTILKRVKVDDILTKEKKAPVEVPGSVEDSLVQNLSVQNVHEKIHVQITPKEHDADKVEDCTPLSKQKVQSAFPYAAVDHGKNMLIPAMKEDSQLIDAEGEEESIYDDIANKIAVFENDLALTCPICRVYVLKEKSTSTGKIFYSCSSRDCNFISWGKPHFVECKRCKNTFLVEATDTSGQIILKCPRATCQHRQSVNPRKVKVVRKRLVRRRK